MILSLRCWHFNAEISGCSAICAVLGKLEPYEQQSSGSLVPYPDVFSGYRDIVMLETFQGLFCLQVIYLSLTSPSPIFLSSYEL